MDKHLRALTLAQKTLLCTALLGIIPVLSIGAIAYHVTRSLLLADANKFLLAMAADQRANLEWQLSQAENLIAKFAAADDLIADLDRCGQICSNSSVQERINRIFDRYVSLDSLVSIEIITMNGATLQTGGDWASPEFHEEKIAQIYGEIERSQHQIYWIGSVHDEGTLAGIEKVVTAASILHATDAKTRQMKPVALLLVNFNAYSIWAHFSQFDTGKDAYIMVIDEESQVLFHPDPNMQGRSVSPDLIANLTEDRGVLSHNAFAPNELVAYERSGKTNWWVLCFMPYQALLSSAIPILSVAISTLAVTFLILTLFFVTLSRKILSPIRQITQQFRLIQSGQINKVRPFPPPTQGDEIGELIQWFNAFLDSLVTRNDVEQALRDSEERYSLALRGANDGIWDWDLRSNVVHYSSRWKSMVGVPESQTANDPEVWFSRVHPEDEPELLARLEAHLAGKTPHFESEHRLRMPDGKTFHWFLARGIAVRDSGEGAHRVAGSITDITERKVTEERLRYDALHDSLTNLPNRAYFMNRLKRTIDRAHRNPDYNGAMLFLDLDRFKIVNDSLGHAVGDQLLLQVAGRLADCLRSSDIVARFGGDEFTILIDGLEDFAEAQAIAGRLQKVLLEPVDLEGHELSLTASIGIVEITPEYNLPEEIVRDADTALYQAKANGRACSAVFDPHMHSSNLNQLRMEAELRRAVEREEFILHFQPIISLNTGQVTGVEALIRWQHPIRGLIPPAEFIYLAEENGLIFPIGEWVIRAACAQIRQFRCAGHPDLTISINISGRQFRDPNLINWVENILAEQDLPGSALEFEITESVAMSDFSHAVKLMDDLQALGIQLSIDDFGTSYSSLGYLKRFPMDKLKIDRSFIIDSTSSFDGAAITSAIIAMAHILGLKVVAEGVDSPEQLKFLNSQNCDSIQGNIISPPLPADEMLPLLGRSFSSARLNSRIQMDINKSERWLVKGER